MVVSRWAAGWLVLVGAGACAPSPRMVYQGNAAFEHCYAAEHDPEVDVFQREACWQAWLAHYTRHQDADRIDYALRRLEALQVGDLSLPSQAPRTMRTGEDAADPGVLAFEAGGEGDPIRSRNSMEPYAVQGDNVVKSGCKVTCQQLGLDCVHACEPGFEPCLETCDSEERICEGGCY